MQQRNGAESHPHRSLAPRIPRYLLAAGAVAAAVQSLVDASPPRPRSQTLHAQILTSGLRPTDGLSVKLLLLHLRCGSHHNARAVFDGMPAPTHAAHNYLVAGYFRLGFPEEALGIVRRLARCTGRMNVFVLSMALKILAALALPAVVREVHARVLRSVVEPDDVLSSALVDAYVKNGEVGYARRVFDVMPARSAMSSMVSLTALIVGCMNKRMYHDAEEIFKGMDEKDVVVYNAMVEGYSKTEETAESSMEVFKAMQRVKFRPTISTFVSVLGACSLLSSPELGEQVHCQVIKSSLFSDVKAGSALLDMYSKCGRVEDGRRIFDRMPERNVITWTSMIDGYGKNGLSDEALQLFDQMQQWRPRGGGGVRPNHATFLSVLSACARAGLLSQGQEVFQSMERDHALTPRMEHYACMVDLLGRFGSVRRAHEFIGGMPVRPGADVWAALLGAATLHGDVEMADLAAREVFELSRGGEGQRPGAYMAMSNTLAAAGEWDGVHQVREMMRRRGVLKDAACSWVGSE
uniref:Pentacotripeptide-repeat region of PRORP domain-containing protein n=1 Tax=Leersia perrieri TaxID=77586 RepID=A0A0D9VUD5_9ORYZ